MNLLLHGIGSREERADRWWRDALAADPGERFDVVLTNPPFGKKSSTTIVGADGKRQHREGRDRARRLLGHHLATSSSTSCSTSRRCSSMNGRAAVVLPDNVLFEGGAGETIRRKLLHECDVHTLLRLPTGLFYAQGVKANVLFFDKQAGQRDAVDQEAVDLRPAHQQALHAEDQPAQARRPGRVRAAATTRRTATTASADLERREARTAAGAPTTTTS